MKISLLFIDGDQQLTLHPEGSEEENILSIMKEESDIKIVRGSTNIYHCQGGYYRGENFSDRSNEVVIVISKREGK